MGAFRLVKAKVSHARSEPVRNRFRYPAFYFCAPLDRLQDFDKNYPCFGYQRAALVSLHLRDYGPRDGSDLDLWVQQQLQQAGIDWKPTRVYLLAMPRNFGFVFNPVSFWFCCDQENRVRAVVAQVHNTFRELHSYVCAKPDLAPIQASDRLYAHKDFHVSPFFQRDGKYEFAFAFSADRVQVDIRYCHLNGDLKLFTQLAGPLLDHRGMNPWLLLLHAPFISAAASLQIGWQALKLRVKGLPWVPKPDPKLHHLTPTSRTELNDS